MKEINKTGVIVLISSVICIIAMIYFPYMSFTQSNGKIRNTNKIFDMLGKDWSIDMLSIPFWYSIIIKS